MKLPVQVAFRGMAPTEAVEKVAREKAAKLEQFHAGLMACRVEIEQLEKHRQQGRPFLVRLDVTLPGHELTVNQQPDEDVQVALRDAFDAMKRQLQDVVRRMQGQEKVHAPARRSAVEPPAPMLEGGEGPPDVV